MESLSSSRETARFALTTMQINQDLGLFQNL